MSELSPKSFLVERIRPEGVAVEYENLNDSQQEAFRRLLYTMDEAVENIATTNATDLRFRPNNVVFISGSRGTGKTCLLHSFMRYTENGTSSQHSMELKEFLDQSPRRGRALKRVQESVVWLPAIDIDPLPRDFNLVSSVLVRIQKLIESQSEFTRQHSYRSARDIVEPNDVDIDGMYEKLLCDAAQGWQGGLVGADHSQEPETFAVVASSLAEANVDFSSRFRKFINVVAQKLFTKDTIFVLPIDDTDLKPATGLSVLKLLRMLHAPRLFVVAMGDIALFELVSSLEMMRELGLQEDLDSQTLLPVKSETVRRHVSGITATAIRKLIPPDQRIELEACPIVKGLDFRPQGANLNLAQLLDAVPVVFHDHVRPKVRVENGEKKKEFKSYDDRIAVAEKRMPMRLSLSDFLFPSRAKGWNTEHQCALVPFAQKLVQVHDRGESSSSGTHPRESSESQDVISYFGQQLLQSSARRVADLWFSVRRLSSSSHRIAKRHATNLTSVKTGERVSEGDTAELIQIRKTVVEAIESGLDCDWGAQLLEDYRLFWGQILRTFRRLCRQSLMEEDVLDVDAREAVDRAFDEHADHVDWSHFPLSLRPTWSAGKSSDLIERRAPMYLRVAIPAESESPGTPLELTTGASVRFHFCYPEQWTVETASTRQVREDVLAAQTSRRDQFATFKYRPISTDTAALVALYHDLLKFSPSGDRFSTHFADMSVYEGLPWASTDYEIGPKNKCNLYWPAPPCVSVYGLDHFKDLWRQITSRERIYEIRPERFALAWMIFGCAMVNSNLVAESTLEELLASKGNVQTYAFFNEELIDQVVEKAMQFANNAGRWASLEAPNERKEQVFEQEWEKLIRDLDDAEAVIENGKSKSLESHQETIRRACELCLPYILSTRFYQYLASFRGQSRSEIEAGLGEQIDRLRQTSSWSPKQGKDTNAEKSICIEPSDFVIQGFFADKGPPNKTLRGVEAKRFLEEFKPTVYEEIGILRLCRKARIHLKRCAEKALKLMKERPDSDAGINYRDWLLNVITLSMPEFGFDGNFRQYLLFATADEDDCLIDFIQMHRRTIRVRRARRLAKLVWLGIPHTAIRLAYSDPNLWGKLTRLTKRGFFRAFHFVHEQHGELQKGLLWFNDDQRVAEIAKENLFKEVLSSSESTNNDDRSRLLDFLNVFSGMPGSRELTCFLGTGEKASPDQVRQFVDSDLASVARQAAVSMSTWDSSSPSFRTYGKRIQCVKRLWWLETSAEEKRRAKAIEDEQDSAGLEQDEYPYLSGFREEEDFNFEPWQHGRGLTPSIEEIDLAGKTTYGFDNWEPVSLRRFSYDLDFAEESHFRRS